MHQVQNLSCPHHVVLPIHAESIAHQTMVDLVAFLVHLVDLAALLALQGLVFLDLLEQTLTHGSISILIEMQQKA